jgi:soluble lytic murein transglycosylase
MNPVYERAPRRIARRLARALAPLSLALFASLSTLPHPARAQGIETTVVDARDAFRRHDRVRLAALKAQAAAERNPLAMWVEYWELTNRINEVQPPEFAAFVQRWPATYVEDRLRNDWLLELVRRRDLATFAAEYPRFRMNDDREVTCFALANDQLSGKDVREAAIAAWLAQKEADDGCAFLAATLVEAKQLAPAAIWKKVRVSIEANRPRAARQAAGLISDAVAAAMAEVVDGPARYLAKKAGTATRADAELTTAALLRLAATDSESAATLLDDRWERALPADLASYAWASVARQTAIKLQPEASDQFLRSARLLAKTGREIDLSDETLAWKARAALRADNGRARWQQVVQSINAMTPAEQKDAAWVYWKARGLQALARDSQEGESLLASGRELLAGIATQLSFYGALAAEDLGQPQTLPPRPAPLTPAERDTAAADPGLARALTLVAIGLRPEGVREWNYSIRGLGDRELLAAAQLACEREVWDRCINTSDKSRAEIDVEQRFPTPLRKEVVARAREIGPRSGVRLRADPPGVALHPRCALGRRRLRADAADAGDGEMDGQEDRPAVHAGPDRRPRHQPAPRQRVPQARPRRHRRLAGDGRGGVQRRPGPAAQVARGAGPRRRRVGREHPVRRDARLRQEGALEQQLLRHAPRRPQHDDPLAPRPHDRPARPERAAARKRPALTRAARARRESSRARDRHFLSHDTCSSSSSSARPASSAAASAKSWSSAPAAPTAGSASRRGSAREHATSSCCRRSRSTSATSTTTRRWR